MIIPFLGVGLGSCLLYCSGKNTSVFLHAFLYKLFPAIGNKQGLQRALFSPNNESGVSIGIPAGSHTGYGLSPRAISRWPRAGSILSATRTEKCPYDIYVQAFQSDKLLNFSYQSITSQDKFLRMSIFCWQ